jgi:hypothetical protein
MRSRQMKHRDLRVLIILLAILALGIGINVAHSINLPDHEETSNARDD